MVVTAGKRLKSENGASLVAALLFFVLCGVAASMILAAASASAGKMQQVPVTDQRCKSGRQQGRRAGLF